MPSRSASRSRTSPSGGPASPSRRRRPLSESGSAPPTTRPSSPDGSPSSSRRSPSSARSSSGTGARSARGANDRTVNPYALRLDDGNWYVVGHDLDRDTVRTFKVSRIQGDIRFATRRERDFRVPPDFDVEEHRIPRPWQIGEIVGTARIAVSDDTAWWVERTLADAGSVEDGVFETDFAHVELLAGWVLRQNGRAVVLEPEELRDAVAEGLNRLVDAHAGDALVPAGPKRADREAAAARASGRPGRAGALRRAPGAPRAVAGGVRRRALGRARRRGARGPDLDPDRGAAGSPLAAQPRQLRRWLLRRLRGARRRRRPRRQGALRRRLPPPAEAHAARGAGDPARDRVRRPHDRRRGAHAAEARPQEARGDVRPLRPRGHARTEGDVGRGDAREGAERGRREAAALSRSST